MASNWIRAIVCCIQDFIFTWLNTLIKFLIGLYNVKHLILNWSMLILVKSGIWIPSPNLAYKTNVMRSVKTRRMSQNAKLCFRSHFKAEIELFPERFKFCVSDIHIQSYDWMVLSSSILLYTSFLTISSHFSKYRFATSDGFSQNASHISIFGDIYRKAEADG